jgi:hypothetical protein
MQRVRGARFANNALPTDCESYNLEDYKRHLMSSPVYKEFMMACGYFGLSEDYSEQDFQKAYKEQEQEDLSLTNNELTTEQENKIQKQKAHTEKYKEILFRYTDHRSRPYFDESWSKIAPLSRVLRFFELPENFTEESLKRQYRNLAMQ